jgi:tetratricopeptide (TPR) repeat protein
MFTGVLRVRPELCGVKLMRKSESKTLCRWLLTLLVVLCWPVWTLTAQSPLEKAQAALAAGDRQEAIRILRPFIAAEPDNADGRLVLGTVLALDGVLGESVEHLQAAVRLRPDWAAAHNTLGMALSRFGQIAMARASFAEAVRLDADMAQAQVNLALILAQSDELNAGLQHLERAVESLGERPEAAYPRFLRAKIWMQQGQAGHAAQELERAVGLRPDYAEGWALLGQARRSLRENAAAVAAFQKAVALNPDDGASRSHLGALQLQTGKTKEAVTHLRVAARLHPQDRSTLYNLMRALQKEGQREEAGQVNARLAAILKNRSESEKGSLAALALNNEAVELQQAGRVEAAIEKYRAAVELHPTHAGFRLNYGLALCEAELWGECVTEIEESLSLEPGNPKATQALYVALEKKRAAEAGPQ